MEAFPDAGPSTPAEECPSRAVVLLRSTLAAGVELGVRMRARPPSVPRGRGVEEGGPGDGQGSRGRPRSFAAG